MGIREEYLQSTFTLDSSLKGAEALEWSPDRQKTKFLITN